MILSEPAMRPGTSSVIKAGDVVVGRDFVLGRDRAGPGAVRLDVAVDAAERDGVSDGRALEIAHIRRPADHQLAEPDRRSVGQPGMHGVLDRADPLALRHRELQRVLAGRKAGGDVVLKRRRHAVHDRLQARIAAEAFDDSPLRVGQRVGEGDDLRRRSSRTPAAACISS